MTSKAARITCALLIVAPLVVQGQSEETRSIVPDVRRRGPGSACSNTA